MSTPDAAVDTPARRPGRPRSTAIPEAIVRAAAMLFAERGFSATSVRDIAASAGCDPSVVIRHFGSKEKLFLQAVTLPPHFAELVEGPLDTLGRDILRRLIEADDSVSRLYKTLLSALDRPDVRRYLVESTTRNIVNPLAARLTGPGARLRAQLVAAQIGGLLMSVCLSDEPSPEVAGAAGLDCYAEAIQVLIGRAGARRSRGQS